MTIRLGKIAGIPIFIDLSWFVIFALIVYTLAEIYFPRANPDFTTAMNWLGGVIAALLLFASVLAHELMHSITAIRRGTAVSSITLFIFGGVSRMTEEPSTPESELKIAIAGPATSFLIAAVVYAFALLVGKQSLGPLWYEIIVYVALINAMLGVFNMVPGFPLDGGRVLRAILWDAFNDLDKATKYASQVGQGFGYLFIFVGFWMMLFGGLIGGLWLVFIGWYLNNAAQQSYQQVLVRRTLSGVNVHQVMTTDFPHVPPDTPLDDFVHSFLLGYDYSAFPVMDGDDFVGVVSINEIKDVPKDEWHLKTVRDIAHSPDQERIIDENDDAFEALMHMAQGNLRRLLVMHDGKLAGMVNQDSILNLVRKKLQIGV